MHEQEPVVCPRARVTRARGASATRAHHIPERPRGQDVTAAITIVAVVVVVAAFAAVACIFMVTVAIATAVFYQVCRCAIVVIAAAAAAAASAAVHHYYHIRIAHVQRPLPCRFLVSTSRHDTMRYFMCTDVPHES